MLTYILITLSAFFMSVVSGFIMIPQILRFCEKRKLYDTPNARKLHKNNIPRLGGVSFMPSMFIATITALLVWMNTSQGWKICISPWSIFFAVGVIVIYATGVIDDVLGLCARSKLFMQIIAATLLPISNLYINNLYGFCGIYEVPFFIGAPLTVAILVFIMNCHQSNRWY